MIRKLTTGISPASLLAMVALFVALGGGAYAAAGKIGTGEIRNGAVTKVKIRKNAVTGPKIRNNVVTGAKVNEATLGTVPDAAHLAGKAPSAFESKGFGGSGPFVGLAKNAVTEVASQSLPAGTYLILARGGLNNNGEELKAAAVTCTLEAGGATEKIGFGAIAKTGVPGERDEFSLQMLATLPSPGDAVLSCDTNSEWSSGNVTGPSLIAVSLQP